MSAFTPDVLLPNYILAVNETIKEQKNFNNFFFNQLSGNFSCHGKCMMYGHWGKDEYYSEGTQGQNSGEYSTDFFLIHIII